MTLEKSNLKLEVDRDRLEAEQKVVTNDMNDYEKESSNEVLLLNNEISTL